MGFIPGSHLDTVSSGAAHNMRRPRRPSRPELGDVMNDLEERNAQNTFANICRSTAEIAANSPRYRRKSSTFIDGIHDLRNDSQLAPAQLYSTMSGRLFHSGRIAIVLVGLPARGKTHISVSLARYLRWLGVKTQVFHLGDYRRASLGPGQKVPDDYFFPAASADSQMLRSKILRKCRDDIYTFLNHENGQVAIYDAVNPLAEGRRSLAREFAKHDVQTLFLESYVADERILEENARKVKINSPDYQNMARDEAARAYLRRIHEKIPVFETMTEKDLNFVKLINAGERMELNNASFGYLSMRVIFFLMNLHTKTRTFYFARAGVSSDTEHFKADATLCAEGAEYAKKMSDCVIKHREACHAASIAQGAPDEPLRPMLVWTSTRKRTIETAEYLASLGYKVLQRSQMSQLDPGVCEKMTDEQIRREYPDEVKKHEIDPYHHRFPRAESYHDLAVRLEPVILELEREKSDVLIIAHESVLRVLYGYLMANAAMDIPTLGFPRHEIIEITSGSYRNEAKAFRIPGVPIDTSHPSNLRSPFNGSGSASPASGFSSPNGPFRSLPNEMLRKVSGLDSVASEEHRQTRTPAETDESCGHSRTVMGFDDQDVARLQDDAIA